MDIVAPLWLVKVAQATVIVSIVITNALPLKGAKDATKKAVRKEWIEYIVINEIRKFLYDDEAIDEMIKIVMQAQRQENKKLPLLKKGITQC